MAVVNRVKVYVPKGFESPYPLTIDLQNLLGLKMLSLTGWKIL